MKKLIIILICLAVIGVGVYFYFQRQQTGATMENVLASGAVVYVRLNDVEKNLTKISSLPFWAALDRLDYDMLIRNKVITAQQKMILDMVRMQVAHIGKNPLAKKLFGQNVALAVYPLDNDIGNMIQKAKTPTPKMIEDILSGIVLVTRVAPDVQFAEFLTRTLDQFGSGVTQAEVSYKGQTIRTVTVERLGVSFAFVRFGDLIVFGVGQNAVRASIDAAQGNRKALAQDPKFVKSCSDLFDVPAVVGYVDFNVVMGLIRNQMTNAAQNLGDDPNVASRMKQIENMLSRMSGMEALGFASQLGRVIRLKTRVIMDPGQMNPEYAPMYTCSSQVNETFKFVPKDVLGYQWSNCQDFEHYWKEIREQAGQKPDVEEKIAKMEARFGLSIERDIIPAFGDEFGGYISDVVLTSIFPIPKFLFFVEVRDNAKAQKLLDKLKEQPMAVLQEENYKGANMKYIALPFGEDVQPGYCFLNGYLLVASSRQLLKDSIDASQNASMSLLSSADFKEVDYGLTDKSRAVHFVRIGKILEKAKGVLDWVNNFVDKRDRKTAAFQAGSQMPLDEANEKIAALEDELGELEDEVIRLEDVAWNTETKGEDVTPIQAQIADLRTKIDDKKLQLTDALERKEELANILRQDTQGDKASKAEMREVYLNEVIYPLLENLKAVRIYGLRVSTGKDALETSVFISVSNW